MTKLLIAIIRLYRLAISPFFGQCCRFFPSCSEYAEEAIRKRGVLKGMYLISKRLIKCFPWHPGGIDEVP